MRYVRAQDVLPENILKIIQKYVDGEYLYIPRRNDKQKSWGEKSGIKKHLKIRNQMIYHHYIEGVSVARLAEQYYLSKKSIRRIISEEKRRIP